MSAIRRLTRVLLGAGLMALVLGILCWGTTVGAQDKKKEKDPNEGKKGKTIGTLVDKQEKFIEVKADGEEKGRRYVPRWIGGNPADGGGFDKATLKTFRELKVGSRVEVEWIFEERFRAVKVKVLAAPKEKG
jgi:hypothetical protein